MSDWPNADAKACYDHAIHCLQAKQLNVAVRDPGPDHSMEVIVWARELGQWAIVDVDPLHALALAAKLIEGARLRLK